MPEPGAGVQGCSCPTCANLVYTAIDGWVLCRRCYRAGCSNLAAEHPGPACTARDCVHDHA